MKHILSYSHDDLDLVIDRMIGASISVGDTLILMRENDINDGGDPLLAPWIVEIEGAGKLTADYLNRLIVEERGFLEIQITEKRINFNHIKYWFKFVDAQGDDPYLKFV